jgi:hypothetical protein
MTVNLYNSKVDIHTNQSVYDSFNSFIFSEDRNIFNKLCSRFEFYNRTQHLLGDIVECGVFKGSGLFSWLKMLEMNEPNSIKKVIGFDFFNPDFVQELSNKTDKDTMLQVFTRCVDLNDNDVSLSGIETKLKSAKFNEKKYELVAGDISVTTKTFIDERPGFRISVLYMDLDLDEPTYNTLNNLWDRVVTGGIVVFDEHTYHSWSEANAVDRFVKENDLTIYRTNVQAPTAYIVK